MTIIEAPDLIEQQAQQLVSDWLSAWTRRQHYSSDASVCEIQNDATRALLKDIGYEFHQVMGLCAFTELRGMAALLRVIAAALDGR